MSRAVILAGGKGTRLAPYTAVLPKPLLPLDDTPILEIVLRQLGLQGFRRVTLAVGHLSQLIEAYFGDGSGVGVQLEYVREREPLGTAGSIKNVSGIDEPFLVMNGDVLTTLDYATFLRNHVSSGADISISTYVRSNTVDFGVIRVDDAGRVTGYLEKPADTYLVSMGVYAVSPPVLSAMAVGERVDFPDLVLRVLGRGGEVRSVTFEGFWLDIGRHEDFERAQLEFAQKRDRFLPPSEGR